MLFIFGFKRYVDVLGVVTFVCGHCHHPAAQRVERWTNKFTLFFVPLFTTSTKHVVQCAFCAATSRVAENEATRLLGSEGAAVPRSPQPRPGERHRQG